MDEQLVSPIAAQGPERITVSEALFLVWEHHLKGKACARPYKSNRKALCKTIGHVFFDALTEQNILKHMDRRKAFGLGPQTIRHDIKLIVLAFNLFRRWKRKKYVMDGVNFSVLQLPEDNPCIDIKRPRCTPRKRILSPEEFSVWIEHSCERLKERSYFALDTGLSPIDLKRMTVDWYNPQTDCLDLSRHKSGVAGSIPVSNRCRVIILKAISEGRRFILDWTNEQSDYEAARKASKIYFQFGRDLRKTYYNRLKNKVSQKALQRAMLHGDYRTGLEHYDVDMGEDLRPAILALEQMYKVA